MSKLQLVPEIYISDGFARIVNRQTGEKTLTDAVDLAVELEEIGFNELLLFDIDGTQKGEFTSNEILNEIAALTSFEIIVGGGIRTQKMRNRFSIPGHPDWF